MFEDHSEYKVICEGAFKQSVNTGWDQKKSSNMENDRCRSAIL